MEKKKPKKKVTKIKPSGDQTKKKAAVAKILRESSNPITIETKSPLTEEEQNENPLGRMKMSDAEKRGYIVNTKSVALGDAIELPNGFKTADKVTEKDDLEFENKKLRDMLMMWNHKRMFNGMWYYFLVDPINQTIDMFDTDPTAGGGE